MAKVSPKKNYGQDNINEISAKLMDNPEIAKLIGELAASTSDASDLVNRNFSHELLNIRCAPAYTCAHLHVRICVYAHDTWLVAFIRRVFLRFFSTPV